MGQKLITSEWRHDFDNEVNALLDEGYRVVHIGCRFNTYERWWAVLEGPTEPAQSMASDAVVAMTKMDATIPQQDIVYNSCEANKPILKLKP